MSRRTLTILYNLQAYLDAQAPSVPTVAGGILEDDDRDMVFLIQNGGTVQPWYDRKDIAIQVMARNRDRMIAENWCSELAAILRGGYGGVELPEVVENGTTYPAVTAWQFNPQGEPGYIGVDANRLHMWSANFIVTIGG